MIVNLDLDSLRKTLRDLEQEEKLNRADRSVMIRLLRELLEASSKVEPLEDSTPGVVQVSITGNQAKPASDSLDKPFLEEAQRQRMERLQLEAASLNHALSTILEKLFDQAPDLYDAYLFLYEAGRLTFGAGKGIKVDETLPWRSPRPRGLTYTVARLGQTMIIPDMSTHPLFAEEKWEGSIVGIPLKVGPRVVGVLTVARKPAREFKPEELRAIQALADQAAIEIENTRIESLAREQIRIDASTGLHNRRALDERLQVEAFSAAQVKVPFAFFLLQLEGYDEINQRYGHSAGDFILAETATAIAKELRRSDFLARFDPARWGLVLGRTDRSTALGIAERIEDIISRRRFSLPEKGSRKVTLTVGVAVFPDDGQTPAELIGAAEAALSAGVESPGSIHFASQPEEGGAEAFPAP